MTAAGKILYLPVPSPMKLHASGYGLSRRQAGAQQSWPEPIYRIPPRERPDTFAYTSRGHASTDQVNGTIIDLYA
jgi:hypothetical protein